LPSGATSGKPLKELDVPRACLACRPEKREHRSQLGIHLRKPG
jgi:hypothetical protein